MEGAGLGNLQRHGGGSVGKGFLALKLLPSLQRAFPLLVLMATDGQTTAKVPCGL